jgi:hypothetical protein
MSVTHYPRLDQGQEVEILIALMDEGLQVSDALVEGILLCIEEADEDIWDVSWMDVPAAHHVVGSDGRPLITEEVYLKVTLLGDVVSWKMGMLNSTFDRSCLDCEDPHLFLKGEIKETLRSAAGDLLANRLG